MSNEDQSKEKSPQIFLSPADYFREVVENAIGQRGMKTLPLSQQYLVNLLNSYVHADRLFEEEESGKRKTGTLAELYLKANQAPPAIRIEMLKKLGDMSLYISGFFGDSLSRKVVDIDYYVEMGGTAYGSLASDCSDDLFSKVYEDFASRFLDYVDVLTVISQKSRIQTNHDLLRLYDRYLATGSKLAEDELKEKGMLNPSLEQVKSNKQ